MKVTRDDCGGQDGDGAEPSPNGRPPYFWVVLVLLVGLAGLPVMWWWPELGGVLHWLVTVVAMVLEIMRQGRPQKP